ncbi:TPA: hypothetical protein ACGO61_000913 [Streptococcus suis]
MNIGILSQPLSVQSWSSGQGLVGIHRKVKAHETCRCPNIYFPLNRFHWIGISKVGHSSTNSTDGTIRIIGPIYNRGSYSATFGHPQHTRCSLNLIDPTCQRNRSLSNLFGHSFYLFLTS